MVKITFQRPFPAPGLSAAYCQGPLCGISIVGGLHVVIAHCPRSLYNSNGKGYGACQGTKRACRPATESHAMSVRPIYRRWRPNFCKSCAFWWVFLSNAIFSNRKILYIDDIPWLTQDIVLHCFCNWFLCVFPLWDTDLVSVPRIEKSALHTQSRLYLCQ